MWVNTLADRRNPTPADVADALGGSERRAGFQIDDIRGRVHREAAAIE